MVDPIASNPDYAADVARAQRFAFLVQEGVVTSLVEAALRFAISKPEVSIALLGISSQEQAEQACAAIERGPLPPEAIAEIHSKAFLP